MFICKHCSMERKSKMALNSHEGYCKLNPNRTKSYFETNQNNVIEIKIAKGAQNQFTKAIIEGKMIECKSSTREKYSINARKRKYTEETKQKLREAAYKNKLGGHTSKKQIYYHMKNGDVVYLQSSYEIRLAKILDELGICWSRPEFLFWVDDKGIQHRYYPDFLVDDLYLDTKNDYLAKLDARKIELVAQQNDIKLLILTEELINKEYIEALIVKRYNT